MQPQRLAVGQCPRAFAVAFEEPIFDPQPQPRFRRELWMCGDPLIDVRTDDRPVAAGQRDLTQGGVALRRRARFERTALQRDRVLGEAFGDIHLRQTIVQAKFLRVVFDPALQPFDALTDTVVFEAGFG